MAALIKKRAADSKHCKSLGFFKGLTLFAGLPDKEVTPFTDASQIKQYKKGHLIYVEAEQADFFYVICSGWLKLFHTTEEGEEVILAMLTRNSIT